MKLTIAGCIVIQYWLGFWGVILKHILFIIVKDSSPQTSQVALVNHQHGLASAKFQMTGVVENCCSWRWYLGGWTNWLLGRKASLVVLWPFGVEEMHPAPWHTAETQEAKQIIVLMINSAPVLWTLDMHH